MSLVQLINKRVNEKIKDLSEEYNYPISIKEGIAFSFYSLEKIFNNYNGDIEAGIVDSSFRQERNDYGIDALYLTGNKEIIEDINQLEDYNSDSRFDFHIFQFKKGNSIDVETLLKLKEGIEKVFINYEFPEEENEYLFELMGNMKSIKEYLYENFSSKKIMINIYLCFSGNKELIFRDNNLMSRITDIRNLLLGNGYNNVDIVLVDAQDLIDFEQGKSNISEILKIENSFKYISSGEENKKLNGYIAMVKASEIAKLVEQWQTSLFEANIRDYYTNNVNNEKIIQTSSSEEEAKYFWSFNNGLTITCREVIELPGAKLQLQGMQIVNGCQTSNSIYKAYKNSQRLIELEEKSAANTLNDTEKKEICELKKISLVDDTHLLLKIIETQDEDLVYRITETTNSQTAISAFSIRANDDIHKNIEMFLKDYGYFYERRINFYRNKGVVSKKIIDIKKLTQAYISMINFKPSQAMSNPKKVFINSYNDIFPNSRSVDYELYTIPALIQLKIEQTIKTIQRNKSEADGFNKKLMSYGKFHLGCFILKSMLGDKYTKRGIKEKFSILVGIINNDVEFEIHFKNAMVDLAKTVRSYTSSKEKISSVLKNKDIDNKISRIINGKSK
ncbi:AIPR family protein [Fictibacillus nanhaiensis]|uniref:AIPR family protein n=1 Tax=Fictibacillus nanhaiensis TaxID=742169 RepID=UPI001C95CEBB|nr:AIPR family protein [Fictibacillus nanhaiensis]MBY6036644.1 AIPR family protein [Fictibacillus nanhaiensis]